MPRTAYTLDRLASDLREARARAANEREMIGRVRRIARSAARAKRDWLTAAMCEPDPSQGFGFRLLHEESDHALAAFVASWLPGRGTPPHDHGTWAVVVGLAGRERNTAWRRLDDGTRRGFAEIVRAGERCVGPGEVIALPSGAIHSVANAGDGVAVSLHLYGRHVNHTDRSRFDPAQCTASPYLVATAAAADPIDASAMAP